MKASLVFDGNGLTYVDPIIPESMGKPNADQLQGTPFEKLAEISCRCCYDSLGQPGSRSSAALHAHILDVQNLSILEHCAFTLSIDLDQDHPTYTVPELVLPCANRKGIWLELKQGPKLEITSNYRAIIEWDRHTRQINETPATRMILRAFQLFGHQLAPQILPKGPEGPEIMDTFIASNITRQHANNLSDDQAWISLYLYGSRGFSHEQVRHRFAISQRSTRYVDEDGSPYIEHPLITKFLTDETVDAFWKEQVKRQIDESMSADRETYRTLVKYLSEYCTTMLKLDKTSARKQARGCARNYLGNGLATDMIYSAPVIAWKWILKQRKNRLADAEIRQIYSPALEALKSSCYGGRFSEFELIPSADGIGTVLK